MTGRTECRHAASARSIYKRWCSVRPRIPISPINTFSGMPLAVSDVDETTHTFSISPEPCEGEVLPSEREDGGEQVAQRGAVDIYGPAGTVVLANLSVLHTATARVTTKERKTVQTYYGHPGARALSQFTTVPPELWRDHADPDVRAFYSGLPLNERSAALVNSSPAGEYANERDRKPRL